VDTGPDTGRGFGPGDPRTDTPRRRPVHSPQSTRRFPRCARKRLRHSIRCIPVIQLRIYTSKVVSNFCFCGLVKKERA